MFRKIPFNCVTYLSIKGIAIISFLTVTLEGGKVRSRPVLLPLLKMYEYKFGRNWKLNRELLFSFQAENNIAGTGIC